MTSVSRLPAPTPTLNPGYVTGLPEGIVIIRVCLFVCLLVCSFVRYARCDFSKTKSQIFMKFGTDVQHI